MDARHVHCYGVYGLRRNILRCFNSRYFQSWCQLTNHVSFSSRVFNTVIDQWFLVCFSRKTFRHHQYIYSDIEIKRHKQNWCAKSVYTISNVKHIEIRYDRLAFGLSSGPQSICLWMTSIATGHPRVKLSVTHTRTTGLHKKVTTPDLFSSLSTKEKEAKTEKTHTDTHSHIIRKDEG